MDPNSGQIYSEGARRALERQLDERPNDRLTKRMLDRLVDIPAEQLSDVERMNVRQRKDWARSRNERKRESRQRRGK